jgi:hypothetical protein
MSAQIVELRRRPALRVCNASLQTAEIIPLAEERIMRRRFAAPPPPTPAELAHLPDVVRVTGAAATAGRSAGIALVETGDAERRVLTGGTLAEVEAWLKARGYLHVPLSRGIWQRPILGPDPEGAA